MKAPEKLEIQKIKKQQKSNKFCRKITNYL